MYELFGCPGSGKTTTCKELEQKCKLVFISDFYKETLIGKAFLHIFLKCFILVPKYRKIYHKLLKVIGDYKKHKNIFGFKTDICMFLKYMIFVYYIEEKYKVPNERIIIDEGIVHYLMALYSEYDVSFEVLDKILDVFKNENRYSIGLKIDFNDNLNQMLKRQRKETEIDFLNNNETKKLLQRYTTAFLHYTELFQAFEQEKLINYFKED